ncbi:PH domain-containing protein [Daejeonella sp.]|uniref:PH domain-containing protein n=1 Tax=Daejeonella sp. TaxID=2805397 RepID=UPI0025C37998|nr:PH domain-containing protein [Daejeonella sp.]
MSIEQYLTDEQDPKTAEKVLAKLKDMLSADEPVIYLAIQKRPGVTINPDSIAVSSKRIVFCIPENLGLTTNFITFYWADVKEVSFKEGFLGSKFIIVPQRGENVVTDYIPKVQARKLYQFCNEQMEKHKMIPPGVGSMMQNENLADDYASYIEVKDEVESFTTAENSQTEDDLIQKLQKLKTLFEKQLISQAEYERKKADILSQL